MAGRRFVAAALACASVAALMMVSPAARASGARHSGVAVAHYPGGVIVSQPAPAFELFGTGFIGAGEPTIGVTSDGIVFSDVMAKVVRSTNQGQTWQDVSPPRRNVTLDPYLYVDPKTDRVFKSDLAGTCQDIAYSDDRGANWTRLVGGCTLADHQTIAAGPAVVSPTPVYDGVLYNCSQALLYNGYSTASVCDKSLDGGITWVPTGAPAFSDPSPYGFGPGSGDSGVPGHCNGDIGHVFVGGDGTLFVPRGWCGQPWVAISRDEGATWTRSQVSTNGMNTTVEGGFGLVMPGSGQSDHEAAAVADAAGNVFFLWMALDRLPYLAVSRDGGATWGPPMMVGAPGVNEAWGPALAIDAGGAVAIAYMGTGGSPGAPWTGDYSGTGWTGYLARIGSPLDATPLIVSAAMTPATAPMLTGTCGPDRCNSSVLDFIDVTTGPGGSVWGSFVDSRFGAELVVGRLHP